MREAAWGLAEHAASKKAAKALLDDTSSVTLAAAHSSLTCRVATLYTCTALGSCCMLHVCRIIQSALGYAVLGPWSTTPLGLLCYLHTDKELNPSLVYTYCEPVIRSFLHLRAVVCIAQCDCCLFRWLTM